MSERKYMNDDEFAAFMGTAAIPTRHHSLFRVDHTAAIAELDEELLVALRDEKYATEDKPKKGKPKSKALAEQIAKLRDEMQASKVEVTYRAMTADEFANWVADDGASWPEQLSIQVVEPSLSAEQWRIAGDKFGSGQIFNLVGLVKQLAESQVVTPDLSVTALLARGGADSSKS